MVCGPSRCAAVAKGQGFRDALLRLGGLCSVWAASCPSTQPSRETALPEHHALGEGQWAMEYTSFRYRVAGGINIHLQE